MSGSGRYAGLVSKLFKRFGLVGGGFPALKAWPEAGWAVFDGRRAAPGALWAAWGQVLGLCGLLLGNAGARYKSLGRVWARLGRLLADSWSALGSSWGAGGTLLAALGPGQTRTVNVDDSLSEICDFR